MEKSVGNEKYVAYQDNKFDYLSLSSFNDNPIILIMGEEEKCQSGMFTEFLPTVYTYLHREERKEKVIISNSTQINICGLSNSTSWARERENAVRSEINDLTQVSLTDM